MMRLQLSNECLVLEFQQAATTTIIQPNIDDGLYSHHPPSLVAAVT